MSQAAANRPFTLLRWFAINSFVVVAAVCAVFAVVASRSFVAETIARDAILTAQFIQAAAEAEVRHRADRGQGDRSVELTMDPILDFGEASRAKGASAEMLDGMRTDFYAHLVRLPDALLIKVFSAEGVMVWATAPTLVGQPIDRYPGVVETMGSDGRVARGFIRRAGTDDEENLFLRTPQNLYVENYIPVLDRSGNLALVIVVEKAPGSLLRTLEKGRRLIWGGAVLAGVVIYLALFWFACHMALQFRSQQSVVEKDRNTLSA